MNKTFLNGKVTVTEIFEPDCVPRQFIVTTPKGEDTIYLHVGDYMKNPETEADLEEKALKVYRQHLWVEILNTFCSPDSFGNRPCDNGCYCERCNTWEVNHKYATVLKNEGLDYSFYAKYL